MSHAELAVCIMGIILCCFLGGLGGLLINTGIDRWKK
jgi:hypothetical protein